MDETLNPNRKKLNEEYLKKYALANAMLKDKANDLFIFNKWILGAEKGDENFAKLDNFHKQMCHFVTDRSDRKKLMLIPRSHLKTKLITIGRTTQKICLNPKTRGLIVSASWKMATDILLSVQKNLQNSEKLLELFGDLTVNSKEWSQDRIRLAENDKREATLTAAGVDNNLTGGHFDFIILDDVVSRDNVGTMDQIQKVIQRYKDYLDLLEPGGEMIVIGTRWHDSDLYGWILDPANNIKESYDVMIKKAYEGNIMGDGTDFQALWPGKFSQSELKRRLREEGWAHFSAQYLNDPVPEEDAIFKRTWFDYYEQPDLKGKLLTKFMTIDPAISDSKEADYSAFVVTGMDEFGYLYILDITRARLSPNDIIEEIFRLRDRWQLNDIGLEQVAYQKTLAFSLRSDDRFKKRPFHITELKPSERTKTDRIKGLQPLYENGKVLHNKLLANNIYLEDELVRFPRSTHDDIIDALAYMLDLVYPARQPAARSTSKRRYLY